MIGAVDQADEEAGLPAGKCRGQRCGERAVRGGELADLQMQAVTIRPRKAGPFPGLSFPLEGLEPDEGSKEVLWF